MNGANGVTIPTLIPENLEIGNWAFGNCFHTKDVYLLNCRGSILYGYHLRLTPFFISSPPWVPPPHPTPQRAVKFELQAEQMWPTPPILGLKSSNMLEFFHFEKIIQKNCLPGLRKKFGQQERSWNEEFFWKHHTNFRGHSPCKKKWGIQILKNSNLKEKN